MTMPTVQVDVEGLFLMAQETRRRIDRAVEFLRDPEKDDADRVEGALDVLEN